MFKKGDLDYFNINHVQGLGRGLELRQLSTRACSSKEKVFNNYPVERRLFGVQHAARAVGRYSSSQGNDPAVQPRTHDSETFLQRVYPDNSFFPALPTRIRIIPRISTIRSQASKLLADAGWKDRDSQGRLTKNGQPLQVELLYDNQQSEPYLTTYQEDLRKVGISLNLRLVTPRNPISNS